MPSATTLKLADTLRTMMIMTLLTFGSEIAQPHAIASVPNPIVVGPIAATVAPGDPSHDYPFFSTPVDLAARGYVEEEYFFDGVVSRYDIPAAITLANTPMTTANVIESDVPYRTRMIVRRPASPNGFSGTVLIEWQNVSFGYDIDAVWLTSFEHLVRRGYAWIGVSAQRVGVHAASGLRAWSPARYATLDLTAGGTRTDDSLQYDVFSQAAQAVRHPVGIDPMGGLTVERIIAAGVSQGAIRLVAYHNAVHPLAGVFDGFMPVLHGAALRTDLGTKVFKVLSETDVWRDQIPYRQLDSDTLRRWEVAGSAHLDFRFEQQLLPLQVRDLGVGPIPTCTSPPFSRIPLAFVMNAALDHMVGWIKNGVAPPTGPDIETVGVPEVIARDGFGNALGGIRLSQHAVPTATNTGVNGPPANACRTYGSYMPFSDQTLAALYGNHGAYVSQVARVTGDNLGAGYIVVEDAEATIREAARAGIGRR
ncbi:MAG: alpha/beta hydrolase domain-containing protein [Acidobacteriota bacterium]